jgi:hypothetical protein
LRHEDAHLATLSGHANSSFDLLRRSFIESGDPLVAEAIRELHVMQGELAADEAAGIVADLL